MWAQGPDDPPVKEPENLLIEDNSTNNILFCKNEPFICDLSFDIKKMFKEKGEEKYQEAKLSYFLEDSVRQEKTMRLKARGIFRKDHCYVPPIKLNLKKSVILSGDLKGITKLKLVTCCKYSKLYEQYVLKEYLAYKLYNLLTDYSFHVRLIQIGYIDISKKNPKKKLRFGFAIEDVDEMAERNDAIEIDINTLNQSHINKTSMNRVALFQYMIGNTDWSVPGLHNFKLVKTNDHLKLESVVVPYDFDYSGFVNTSYSTPDERLSIDNVRERLFRGICCNCEEYESTIQEFIEKKDQIYQLILEFEYIEEITRNEILTYIDEFFRVIELDDFISRNIMASCLHY